jgi:hypothetical protein
MLKLLNSALIYTMVWANRWKGYENEGKITGDFLFKKEELI